jgi:hypothetical protein
MEEAQWMWMGVRPGPEITRISIQETRRTVLKARLPDVPQHPRALETLAEGVALWCGRPLYVALGVADEETMCVSPHWHATMDVLTRTPLVTIERPSAYRVPRGAPRTAATSVTSGRSAPCAAGSATHDPARGRR